MTVSTFNEQQRPSPPAEESPSAYLDAYFRRIHYHGDRDATLATLQSVHRLHPQHIPFENLNPLLRIPVKLDIHSVVSKMVYGRRGGYCFEQNFLLKTMLEFLGFDVKGLAARVVWNGPVDAITARSHMLLLVTIDGAKYIADVGFGGVTLTSPLELKAGAGQQTPHETFRLVEVGDEFRLEALLRGEWKALYRFGLQENFPIDYEVSSWYLSNHPDSHFVTGLIAARVGEDCRHTLRGNEYSTHHVDGETIKRLITDIDDLLEVLSGVFGIDIPDMPEAHDILRRALDNKNVR